MEPAAMAIESTKAIISFNGSAAVISQYLDYCFNSILYQRGIYPSGEFKSVNQYGMGLFKSKNPWVVSYLKSTLDDVQMFITRKDINQVTLAISNTETREVLEYWDFDVRKATQPEPGVPAPARSLESIQAEIRAVLKQITSCGTFMPLLEDKKCSFDVQVTASRRDMVWPPNWKPVVRVKFENPASLNFRSFSTGVHMICSSVTYRNPE